MVISQTPYRVSLAGGGTGFPESYRREFGSVLSATIDKYTCVTVHRRFEASIRISNSKAETSGTIDVIQHDLDREAMRLTEIDEPLEIPTIGDVPAGTGMGSSSSSTFPKIDDWYEAVRRNGAQGGELLGAGGGGFLLLMAPPGDTGRSARP